MKPRHDVANAAKFFFILTVPQLSILDFNTSQLLDVCRDCSLCFIFFFSYEFAMTQCRTRDNGCCSSLLSACHLAFCSCDTSLFAYISVAAKVSKEVLMSFRFFFEQIRRSRGQAKLILKELRE